MFTFFKLSRARKQRNGSTLNNAKSLRRRLESFELRLIKLFESFFFGFCWLKVPFRFVCCERKRPGRRSPQHQWVEVVSALPQLQFPPNNTQRTLHSATSLTFRDCANQLKIHLSCGKLKKFRAFFAVGCADADGSRLSRSTLNHRTLRAWESGTV